MVTTVCPSLPNTKIGSELLTAELRTAGGQEQHEYPYLPPSLVPGDCLSLKFPHASRNLPESLVGVLLIGISMRNLFRFLEASNLKSRSPGGGIQMHKAPGRSYDNMEAPPALSHWT